MAQRANSIITAQVHNSNGILQIQAGDGRNAVASFRHALEQFEPMLLVDVTDVVVGNPSKVGVEGTKTQRLALFDTALTTDERFYCFTKAIQFYSDDPSHDSAYKNLSAAFCSCVVIFNLALAYQLRASTGNPILAEQRMDKAFRLYESVIHMVNDAGGLWIDEDVASFFKAVALNNQAWIKFQLGSLNAAKELYGLLMEFIRNINPNGRYWRDESGMATVGQILLNSMFLKSTQVASAA